MRNISKLKSLEEEYHLWLDEKLSNERCKNPQEDVNKKCLERLDEIWHEMQVVLHDA
ncbi:hypothetical protein [Listeria booriae]|uniref:hypothetical protein n=1 Tax=Listeria booriae TaxID=1552123 RepID=UPI001626A6D2|nr:hypothetical protein [Listeria booriae]MBC2164943.1 hypothetical protein [Listeria booriae]